MSGSMTSSSTRSGRVGPHLVHGLGAGGRHLDREALEARAPVDEQVGDVRLVVDDQDPLLLRHAPHDRRSTLADSAAPEVSARRDGCRRALGPAAARCRAERAAHRRDASAPPGHQASASTTMAEDIFDSPDLAVDEADRDLDDRGAGPLGLGRSSRSGTRTPRPGPRRGRSAQSTRGRVGPEPGRRVGHPEARARPRRRRCRPWTAGGGASVQLGIEPPGHVARPDDHLVALAPAGRAARAAPPGRGRGRRPSRPGRRSRARAPTEPGPVGAARGPTCAGRRSRCRPGCARRQLLDPLGGAVRAPVVDDQDRRPRAGLRRSPRSPGRCSRPRCRWAR